MKLPINNIQRFSLHDGDGIRTTIFFMGCNIKCPWCANPENISILPHNGFGKYYTLGEIEQQILLDKSFYINGGGVTYSGGEPLLHADTILPLLKNLKRQGINQCVETALFIKNENLKKTINYIDTFIIDIKILTPDKCKKILGGEISLFMQNLKTLFEAKKPIIFRMPLVNNYTYTQENINMLLLLLKEFKPKLIEIFQVHNLANSKYKKLGLVSKEFFSPTSAEIIKLKNQIEGISVQCNILSVG